MESMTWLKRKRQKLSDLLIGKSIPIGSMYGIFTYIWWIFVVNVGKTTILMDLMGFWRVKWIVQPPRSHSPSEACHVIRRLFNMLSIIISCWAHHRVGRKESGVLLPAGARNLEDTGARTKSPLSGAGKRENPNRTDGNRRLWWLPDGNNQSCGAVFCSKGGSCCFVQSRILSAKVMWWLYKYGRLCKNQIWRWELKCFLVQRFQICSEMLEAEICSLSLRWLVDCLHIQKHGKKWPCVGSFLRVQDLCREIFFAERHVEHQMPSYAKCTTIR